jgi:hypothetical protein
MKFELFAIEETIEINRDLCNYFTKKFNDCVPPLITTPIEISQRAKVYQDITTEAVAFATRLEMLKAQLENLPE